jgi:hypothetical protein
MANRMHLGIAALLALALGLATPMAAQKQCHKGIPCGNSCISAAKTCHVGTAAAAPSGAGSRTAHTADRPRDERGRFIRSRSAKARFMRLTGRPNGWPGHVVDHIIPLACGGPDTPENMQWQTVEEGKVKDATERRDCS